MKQNTSSPTMIASARPSVRPVPTAGMPAFAKTCPDHNALRVLRAIAIFCLLAAAGSHFDAAHAASVTWGAATTDSTNSDVFNVGASAYGYDWNSNQTVNGVSFLYAGASLTGSGSITVGNATNVNTTVFAPSTLGAAYDGVLSGGIYNSGNGSAMTVTLGNLTAGHVYATQLWVDDSRSGISTRSDTLSSSGGNTVSLKFNTSAPSAGVGQYAVGGFTEASGSTTQVLTITGSTSNPAQLNAIQVRDVTGVWSGGVNGNWDSSTANFTGGESFSTVSGLVSTIYFADTDGFGNAVTNSNITIQSGGVSTGTIVFQNNAVNYTINSSDANGISGSTAVMLSGAGIVTLNGTNSFTGGLTVGNGTLAVAAINNASTNGALGDNSSVTLGSAGAAGTLEYTGGGTASSNMPFALAASGTGAVQVDTAGTNLTLSGVISGSGLFTKTGAGTLTLTATNTDTGGMTVANGNLAVATINNVSTSGVLGNNSTVTLGSSGNTGILEYTAATAAPSSTMPFVLATGGTGGVQVDNAATTLTLSGNITGSGVLLKNGAGALILSGANTYSGGTTVAAGTLNLNVGNSGGTGAIVLGAASTGTNSILLNLGANGSGGGINQPSITVANQGTGNVTIEYTSVNAGYYMNTSYALNRPTTFEGNYTGGGGAYFANGAVISGNVGTLTLMTSAGSTSAVYFGGANTFVGTIDLTQGTVMPSTGAAFNDNPVVMSGTANLQLNFGAATIGSLAGASTDTVNLTSALTISSTGSATFAGVISNSGALTKSGTGIETLTGVNTYTGATTINAGALQIGNGGTTGSINTTSGVSGLSGGTLAFNLSNTGTFSQVASSAIGLTQGGSGTLVLTGANTYTGPTAVNAGILQIGNGGTTGAIASSSAISGSSGATLAFNHGNAFTVGSVISGPIGVTQAGAGTTTLSGNNSYTGPTSVAGGILYISGTLGNTSITVSNGGGLGGTGSIGGAVTVNGGSAINLVDGSLGTLTLTNGLTIGSNSTASILDFEGNGTGFDLLNDTAGLTISGSATINITALAGLSPGTYNLIDFGSLSGGSLGSLTLGSSFVSGKNLSLVSTGTSEELVVAGASVYWKGGNGTSWNASSPTNWTSDAAGTSGTSAPTSAVDVFFDATNASNPSSLLTTSLGANFDVNSVNFSSVATGGVTISDASFGLAIEAGGITISSGAGPAAISANAVTLNASQAWVNNSGSLLTVTSPIAGTAAASGTTTLTLAGTGSGGALLSGTLGDGTGGGKLALVVNGASQAVTLAANDTYSGGTTITSGTLQVGNGGAAGALGSGAVQDNGALIFNRSDSPTVSNTIAGTGSLKQAGSGAVFLTGANSYTGGTVISAGTLNINADGALGGASGGVTFSGAGVLQAGTNSILLASARGVTINSGITGTIDTQGFNMTVNGAIGGSGSLLKTGTGALTLAGAGNYGGGTTISQGTLNWSNNSGSNSSAITLGDANTGANNVALTLTATPSNNLTVSANGSGIDTISLTAQNQTMTDTITLNRSATLQANYAGIGGAYFNTVTGNLNGGTLTIQSPSSGATYMQGSNSFVGTVALPLGTVFAFNSGAFGNTNPVIMSGNATLDLYGANLSTGNLTGASTNSIVNNASGNNTLTVSNTSSATFAGVITGGGGYTEAGAGTEIFTGSNTYTGATTINAGTLQIGNGGTAGSISATSGIGGTGGTLALDLSTSGTFSKAITGGVGFTQAGSGTLTLTANNTTAGLTTVTNGTLIVAGGLSGSVKVAGGTFIVGSNVVVGGSANVAGGLLAGGGSSLGASGFNGSVVVGTGTGSASSSIIAPSADGGAAGTIFSTVGNLTLNSDAAYQFKLNSNNVGVADELAVEGILTLTGAILTGADVGSTILPTDGSAQYVLADAFGGNIVGTFANLSQGGLIQVGSNWFSVNYNVPDGSGGEEVVLESAIPEPGTWGSLLLGLGLLIGLQRRRHARLK